MGLVIGGEGDVMMMSGCDVTFVIWGGQRGGESCRFGVGIGGMVLVEWGEVGGWWRGGGILSTV